MMNYDQIKNWFPESLHQKQYARLILREYLQYMILDFLSNSSYSKHLNFIGGTSLRLVYGIDRFSEDLDFDHKDLDFDHFVQMTDQVVRFLLRSGINVKAEDKEKDMKLNAFRRNLVFPEFLFEQKLSPFKDEKFLIKIESQDQLINYKADIKLMRGCGYVFNFRVPPPGILCSMKLSALLNRAKGRDFYDCMFLLSRTKPDYGFLEQRSGIKNDQDLKQKLVQLVHSIHLKNKSRDFEHLLIMPGQSNKIMLFSELINELLQ